MKAIVEISQVVRHSVWARASLWVARAPLTFVATFVATLVAVRTGVCEALPEVRCGRLAAGAWQRIALASETQLQRIGPTVLVAVFVDL